MKPAGRYRKGAQLEREWVDEQISKGALIAGRFAGSKSKSNQVNEFGKNYSLADCVAIFEDCILVKQLKKGRSGFRWKKFRWKKYAQLHALDGRVVRIEAGIEKV